jgi:aconitate hydratase
MPQTTVRNRFGARTTFDTGSGEAWYYSLAHLEKSGIVKSLSRLPVSIRILLESVLREHDGYAITDDDVNRLANWDAKAASSAGELPFKPARVILQDFTGVACVVDLAAMRSAMQRLGGNPKKINPLIPVDLVIDHSIQVDQFGSSSALQFNVDIEFERNRERYEFLRWGQEAFQNFRVVPPSVGIVHQVNLEYLAKGVLTRGEDDGRVAFPDTLVGTDSHTTMINGLGVVGWGVGGIEAEAVMLGQPLYMVTPEVIGFRLTGGLRDGVTATDLALTVTQMLRSRGVVDKFVEFFGPGLGNMLLPDRATIANMAPEYGATIGYFPVDDETLNYLRTTGRTEQEVRLVERYYKEQGLFRTSETSDAEYTDVLELDMNTVEASMAGPKRPQDRVRLSDMKKSFNAALSAPVEKRGFALDEKELARSSEIVFASGEKDTIKHGAVVIAAITSCTNTSNPSVMLGAGLLAKKAVEKGLTVPAYVKTSLAPGSRVVTEYLKAAELMEPLEKLGFAVVGYGCTTCIGNSGPIPSNVEDAVKNADIVATAVLSGNRNFEGRIHPGGEGELSGVAAAGRGLCHRRDNRHRLRERADWLRQGRARSLPARHLAYASGDHRGQPPRRHAGTVPEDVCQRAPVQPTVERDPGGIVRRPVQLECRQHVYSGAAVLRQPEQAIGTTRYSWCALPRLRGRLDHDGSHLARGQHRRR